MTWNQKNVDVLCYMPVSSPDFWMEKFVGKVNDGYMLVGAYM